MFLIFISFDYYFFIYFYFLRYPKYQKVKIALRISLQFFFFNIILKGFIKQPFVKQCPTFLNFSFNIDWRISVFSLSKYL